MNLEKVALCALLVSVIGCGGGDTPTPDAGTAESDGGAVPDRCSPVSSTGFPGSPCDPLAPACVGGPGCYFQEPTGGCAFECVSTTGPGIAAGGACEFLNDCAPGLACTGGVEGCAAEFCCAPYCEIGTTCAGGVACRAFGITPPIPAGLERVGICAGE